ncbi:uncharacterized protein LOC135693584 [Rhopilema esculentum]|uniref:uncharacterized protein LOC135693584 n=1 Tax=Rhopilema esculentum TaxID=499914 RepID=UPI0031D8B351|eukprot:gene10245-18935_t
MAGNSKLRDSKLIHGVISFQALYRGFRTRKILGKVKEEFRAIFVELEGTEVCQHTLEWRSTFGRPIIIDDGLFEPERERVYKNIKTSEETFAKEAKNIKTVDRDEATSLAVHSSCTANGLTTKLFTKAESDTDKEIHCIDDLHEAKDSFLDSEILNTKDEIPVEADSKTSPNNLLGQNGVDIAVPPICREEFESMGRTEILQMKREYEMELLWIDQAIESRKQYIRFKS